MLTECWNHGRTENTPKNLFRKVTDVGRDDTA